MKYKIGTAAKLLGVSPETLRLYERNGILVSDRGEGENGYRYYSRLDITALMRARSYHQYGFSMRETEALINTDDTDYILEEYKLDSHHHSAPQKEIQEAFCLLNQSYLQILHYK